MLALATGRFTEAERLAREAFKQFSDMGHPAAFGALAVILSQSGLHIGMDRPGLVELFDHLPAHLRPEAVDTTQGVATIFPALTLTLIPRYQGDRAARGGLRAGRPDLVVDAVTGHAHGGLGARARGRHRPGPHRRH